MIVARKRPHEPWELVDIENTLEALQDEVGGYIETVTITTDACLIVNEEGRLRGMPFNVNFCGLKLVGTVLLVGIDGENFSDVPITNLRILPK